MRPTVLFPKIEVDNDKHLLYELDAKLIYADPRGQQKVAAMIKVLLGRRPDLKSKVYENYLKTNP